MTDQSNRQTVRVVIVEDHVLQRAGTTALLDAEPDLTVTHSCSSLPDFVAWLPRSDRALHPHVLVLDLMVDRQPNADVGTVERLIGAGLRIVVLSAFTSPALVRQMLRAGVTAFVSKHDAQEHLVAAVRAVIEGMEWMTTELATVIAGDPDRPTLSLQEERALILYASGLTIDAVATSIGVKRDTAKQYLDRVKRKYAEVGRPVHTKTELGRVAWMDGYLDPAVPGPPPAI